MKTTLPKLHLKSISLVDGCLKDGANSAIDKFLYFNFEDNKYLSTLDLAILNILYSFYLNSKSYIKLSELLEVLAVYRDIEEEVTVENVLDSIEKMRFVDIVVGSERSHYETFLLPMNTYIYSGLDGSKTYAFNLFRRSIPCLCVDGIKKELEGLKSYTQDLSEEEVIDVQE